MTRTARPGGSCLPRAPLSSGSSVLGIDSASSGVFDSWSRRVTGSIADRLDPAAARAMIMCRPMSPACGTSSTRDWNGPPAGPSSRS